MHFDVSMGLLSLEIFTAQARAAYQSLVSSTSLEIKEQAYHRCAAFEASLPRGHRGEVRLDFDPLPMYNLNKT